MRFNSLDYVSFLLVILVAYWRMGRRPQNVLLLAGSYFFYGYVHHWFLGLILASTLIDYAAVQGMVRFPAQRRSFLSASLVGNLGLLGFFKYFGFFTESLATVLESMGLPALRSSLQIVLPVGISFYTFQTLSYTIDVYRGDMEPRRNFLDYAVYVAFFPQLVAGPVERARHFLPQVERERRFAPAMLQDGLVLLAWGFCLKLVIADNVASIVNKVFMVEDPGFAVLWIGTLGFGAQIYADFYGYTCIARGSANLFGFELVHNFHHPYLAQTPADFWRRWNVSVSQWFRDYVYIPLGGNRRMPLRASANVMATFGLSGLWHGASWNFVLWGLYHGALLLLFRGLGRVAPRLLQSPRLAIPRFLLTWTLVQGSWLLFREHDIAQLWTYLTLSPSAMTGDQWHAAGLFLGLLVVYTAPLMIHSLLYVAGVERWLVTGRRGVLARGALVAALVFAILAFRSPASNEFIYFRF